jgi:hypothetical protein
MEATTLHLGTKAEKQQPTIAKCYADTTIELKAENDGRKNTSL